MSKRLQQLIKQKDVLANKAELIVLKRIAAICKKKKLYFKYVGGATVRKDGFNGWFEDEIDDPEITLLLDDLHNNFGGLPCCACDKGVWIEGQTPIILIKKPY
jgi:serine protease inhibitor ecotin